MKRIDISTASILRTKKHVPCMEPLSRGSMNVDKSRAKSSNNIGKDTYPG